MTLGGILFAIGMFWFGWSGYRADVSWVGMYFCLIIG